MSAQETINKILDSVKAKFFTPAPAPVVAPAAQAAPAPAAPAVPAAKSHKLKDGSEISIAQAGEAPAVGDSVTVAGAPAPAGDVVLEDGSTISIDAAGKISAITPAAPVTNDLGANGGVPVAAPAVIVPVAAAALPVAAHPALTSQTPEQLNALIASFASGTPEERIAKLEVVCKALMESCMGYELREAERKTASEAAIEIYKTDLKTATFEAITAAEAKVSRHEETIKGLFELVDALVKMPGTDPVTLTGVKKEQFDRAHRRESRLDAMSKTVAEMRKKN